MLRNVIVDVDFLCQNQVSRVTLVLHSTCFLCMYGKSFVHLSNQHSFIKSRLI